MAPSTPAQLALSSLYDAIRRELEEQFLGRSEALDRREAELEKRERGLEDRLQMLDISDIVAMPSPCRARSGFKSSHNAANEVCLCSSGDTGINSLDKSVVSNDPAACEILALVLQDLSNQKASGFPAGTGESEYSMCGEFAPERLGGQRPLRATQEKSLETSKDSAGDVCNESFGPASRPGSAFGPASRPGSAARSASLRSLAKSRVPSPVEGGQRSTNKENQPMAGFPGRNLAAMRLGILSEQSKLRVSGLDQSAPGPHRMPPHRRSTGSLHWQKGWASKPGEESGLPNVGGSSTHGLR